MYSVFKGYFDNNIVKLLTILLLDSSNNNSMFLFYYSYLHSNLESTFGYQDIN